MKFFSKQNVDKGTQPILAWVMWLTYKDTKGWMFIFHFPLFQLRWCPDIYRGRKYFSWCIPLIGFRHEKYDDFQLKIITGFTYHSDFMEEEVYEDF